VGTHIGGSEFKGEGPSCGRVEALPSWTSTHYIIGGGEWDSEREKGHFDGIWCSKKNNQRKGGAIGHAMARKKEGGCIGFTFHSSVQPGRSRSKGGGGEAESLITQR